MKNNDSSQTKLNDHRREILKLKIRNILIIYNERKRDYPNSYDDIIADDVFATMTEEEKHSIVQKLNDVTLT